MPKTAATEYHASMDSLMPLIKERLAAGQTVRFSPRGISMLPMLRQGIDSVVLSPVPEKLKKYDLPLYQRKNGQYVLHRVVKAADTYTCIGDNQFDLETGLEHDQMIALVTSFYRDQTHWDTRNPLYQLYCRVRHYSRPVRRFWRRGIGWLRRHLR